MGLILARSSAKPGSQMSRSTNSADGSRSVSGGCFEIVDHEDSVAFGYQRIDQVTADESCASGHQNGAGFEA